MTSKIGLFNPDYFAYWEEADWCLRGNRSGRKSVYVPKSKIWHKIAASNTSAAYIYYLTRNKFWFMKKNGARKECTLFLTYFFTYQFWLESGTLLLLYKNFGGFISLCKGVIDGFKKPLTVI